MTASVGEFSLCLAVLLALASILAAVTGARFGTDGPLRWSRWLIHAHFTLLTITSGALVAALLASDFSIEYVAHYTERALPTGYKLAAFWAGQQGSILIWAWLLAAMAAIYAVANRRDRGTQTAVTLATLGCALAFMAALMLFAASPFKPSQVIPADGHGLNPMLQDPGMIAHPPALFMGYAGFTIPFAMMIGALVAGRRDDAWVPDTRRWVIFSWLTLTIGIILGAQWAYVELGWGGYWAWDPVENASLLPWLTGTALLHSIMVQQQRGMLRLWNAALYAATFALCIFGTYITRSGIIQSVHSFQESPVGTMFLGFLIATLLASIAVIVWRRKLLRPASELPTLLGREGAFMATNVLLTGMTLLTLIGTMFPVISRVLSGQQASVGERFYNRTVAPLGMVLIALMAVGPLLVCGISPARRLARSLIFPAIAAILGVIATVSLGIRDAWGLAAAAITAFAAAAILVDLFKVILARVRTLGENPLLAALLAFDTNHRRYGGQVVHVGVIMIMVGIVGSSVFGLKQTYELKPNQSVSFAGRTLTYLSLNEKTGPNYTSVEAIVTLTDPSGNTRTFNPERRFYNKSEQPSSEVALQSDWREDVYLTLAGWENGGALTSFQAVVNPLVSWIWIGGIVMTLGGLVCLLPRLTRTTVTATDSAEAAAAVHAPAVTRLPGRLVPQPTR